MTDMHDLVGRDQARVWHPYASLSNPAPVFAVQAASGVRLKLADGRELIDGMSSWWCAIHGYNHPVLNAALERQLRDMAHVMFGGLTHEPAIRLAERLAALAPDGLECVFFSDSGSVSVEVAIKQALQYWMARDEPRRQRLLTIRGGYHGDTMGAMSVCDPVTGMHSLFSGMLAQQYFAAAPRIRFGAAWSDDDLASMRTLMENHHRDIAAVILEPIVQGAGGMWFYSSDYLRGVRALCDEFGVLLICDEIATGFGRSGRLFACEHAGIAPDIMCVGKALTGGYMTLAATLCTREVADAISGAGAFMHGPTFMANPMACAVADASIDLLLAGPWRERIHDIERGLSQGLDACRGLPRVREVRVLGAIGVVELHTPVDMRVAASEFVRRGVWVRPFGRLVYLMPPYIIDPADLDVLTGAVTEVVGALQDTDPR